MIERRTKEIGIRKVLGASSLKITVMLLQDLAMWIMLANILSLPLAYFIMNKWLQNFAYHIYISWWVLILSGILALSVALFTVVIVAMKRAKRNPILSLKYE